MSAELNYNIHLFYYPWYGSPVISKTWLHWNSTSLGVCDHNPANGDIAANYYPVLGPYDSCDSNVLKQHMQWISETGIGTLVLSWRGKGSMEDRCVTKIMDYANNHLIKVGFHLEPYFGRTAELVVNDIKYISDTYGHHSAYFRDPELENRDAFYVYDKEIRDWSPIDPLKKEHILLALTINRSQKYFSGLYTYALSGDTNTVGIWKEMHEICKNRDMIWSPSIGPGYIDKRAKPHSNKTNLDRRDGKTYDDNWNNVFESGLPHWVSITSFNEWHQGTIIEPASFTPPKGLEYMTYSGAYQKTGKTSETAYLERTAYWVKKFNDTNKSNTD